MGLLCAPRAGFDTYSWQCFPRLPDPPAAPTAPTGAPIAPPSVAILRGAIVPQLNCWEPDSTLSGSIKAYFGYDNRNPIEYTIPAGPGNSFSPAPANRSQISTFLPGVSSLAFSVSFPESEVLTWTLDVAVSVDAKDTATRCPEGV
jgi:hypothetical protein